MDMKVGDCLTSRFAAVDDEPVSAGHAELRRRRLDGRHQPAPEGGILYLVDRIDMAFFALTVS